MNPKETDWYPVTTTPVHIGVYKTRHRGTDMKIYEGYSYFDKWWGYTKNTAKGAAYAQMKSPQQSKEWKGLKEKT
jgi:hypothetical protein